MSESFQKEIPKARVNISLDLHTGGAQKRVELVKLKQQLMQNWIALELAAGRPISISAATTAPTTSPATREGER